MKRMFHFTRNLGTETKGRLTAIQIDYVLDHIGHHAELRDELRQVSYMMQAWDFQNTTDSGTPTAEVVKFKGVFSLLWHNSFFNEREFPGIMEHYTWILNHFESMGMEGITGMEIIRRMKDA